MSAPSPIYEAYLNCVASFELSVSDPNVGQTPLPEDQFVRFNSWAKRSGASVDATVYSSLDNLLKDNQKLQTKIVQHLAFLQLSLDRAMRIFDQPDTTLYKMDLWPREKLYLYVKFYPILGPYTASETAILLSLERLQEVQDTIIQLEILSPFTQNVSTDVQAAKERDTVDRVDIDADHETRAILLVKQLNLQDESAERIRSPESEQF